jgi:hypothetical protein
MGDLLEARKVPMAAWASSVVRLVGERVLVLQHPTSDQSDARAGPVGDVDCVVFGFDRLWPLRLPAGSTLYQSLHYHARHWRWLVERDGGTAIGIDSLCDPDDLGLEEFSAAPLHAVAWSSPPALGAAYLAAKRLRTGSAAQHDWTTMRHLANEDPDAFRQALRRVIGAPAAGLLQEEVLEGRLPDRLRLRRARVLQRLWRSRSPSKLLVVWLLETRRALERVTQPTGLVVLLAGSAVSDATLTVRLRSLSNALFTGQARYHWPGPLPRPGPLIGSDQGDATTPPAGPPYGRLLSCIVLGYHWLDSLLEGWLLVWPGRLRTRLVVVERGWWDVAVDPARYRLDVPDWMVRALGTLLPQPDLVLLLEADPDVPTEGEAELTKREVAGQMLAWERALPRSVRRARLDVSGPSDEVADQAHDQISQLLESRAISRLGAGWSALPRRGRARWVLPRGARAAAAAALAVYHPMTRRGRLAWEVARRFASSGGFRLLPRGEGPPRQVVQALAAHLPPRSTLAVARMTHPGRGRYLALIVGEQGQLHGVAKVATNADAARALDQEAARIEAIGRLLPPPLSVPGILSREPGLLLLEAVNWHPRRSPWRLDEAAAHALGVFFRNGVREGAELLGPAHGDFAPWNLLQTEDGWVLIDWEDASTEQHPYFDLCHYLVQAHVLLGRPSSRAILEGFRDGKGWVGRTVRAYADGAHLPQAQAQEFLESYLIVSPSKLRPRTAEERDGLTPRRRLLAALRS